MCQRILPIENCIAEDGTAVSVRWLVKAACRGMWLMNMMSMFVPDTAIVQLPCSWEAGIRRGILCGHAYAMNRGGRKSGVKRWRSIGTIRIRGSALKLCETGSLQELKAGMSKEARFLDTAS